MEHYVRCQNLSVLAILDTHSHADHESIRPILQKIMGSRMKKFTDFDFLGWPTLAKEGVLKIKLEDGTEVPAIQLSAPHKAKESAKGDLVIASLATPGHTDDSRTFFFGTAQGGVLSQKNLRFVFTGDTILGGGLGRTNFAVSDPTSLFNSLRKLQSVLSPTTLLCPAHDYNNSFATSLKTEIQENPLLSLALGPMTPLTLDEFLGRKRQIDLDLAKLEENFQGMVCGVTQTDAAHCDSTLTVPAGHIKDCFQKKGAAPLVIDVREPQEFSLFKEWKSIGLTDPPRNVPLSRFINFMNELSQTGRFDQDIVLICKSGSRSLQAAKSLRRLGFSKAKSLEGGLAWSFPHL